MRIAIIGPAFPYKGGGAQHTTELAHRLAAAGHPVTVESWSAQYPAFLYPGEQTIAEPEGRPFPGVRRELSWRRPDGWLRLGARLGGSTDGGPYDLVIMVVLSPVQVPSYLGILAGLRRRTRVLALCHNVLPHERAVYDKPLMRALLRRVDGVLVHTEQQAELARTLTTRPVEVAEMPAHLPTPVATPVDAEPAPADPSPDADPLADADADADADPAADAVPAAGGGTPEGVRNRLLFFGLIRPYKGLDVALRALAAGPPEVSMTVAGEFWGGLEETRALIAELDLSERVELLPGYVPGARVPALFAAADALVLPYRAATASQNVWMAFEHGVPVIATRVGSFGEQISDGRDGLLCEPDDVASLTDALKRFYAPGEPERLRAGVTRFDHEPLWEAYLGAVLAR